jgi:hypothetical protein
VPADGIIFELTGPFDAHEASITAAAKANVLALIWSFMLNSAGLDAWKDSVFRCGGLIK